ncbi:two pore domain potassium channel family protein [Amycolatopsis acidicola]|uniref:Two pore domain potassium channel family protein n=1 Tax=Amycolatopsis acidicola TaxID=2596893 RepID=A0A5N0VB50_9PSEU|nr:potassium channel family protein [Amycolatopsis acidicola]KAA9163599.1 two pore domain potassium channel family protein [Amycolatopsis acidicola]
MSEPDGHRGRTPLRGRLPVLSSALRSLATLVVLVTAYYVLPMPSRAGGALVVLIAGLAAVAAVVVWEVRAILRAPYPLLQGIQALALVIPLFLLVFAGAYYYLESTYAVSFSAPLSRTDSLYFVVTVFATVGFGDIVPVTAVARILVTVQMLGDLLVAGLVLRVIVLAVQRGRERQDDHDPAR